MGKANNKKVIKDALSVLMSSLSNLLESQRERTFKYKTKGNKKSRKTFCNAFELNESTVAHIETGRMLGLSFDQIRVYLAALKGKDDKQFLDKFRKVYDGLKGIDDLLRNI